MNTDYRVGDLIYDANMYDGLNIFLSDLQFYKKWKVIAEYTTNDGREVLIKQIMHYENATQMNHIEWHYFINGEFHSIQNMDMRLFFPQELDSYLKWAGFNIIHKFGSFEEEVFKDTSEKQIYVLTFNHWFKIENENRFHDQSSTTIGHRWAKGFI